MCNIQKNIFFQVKFYRRAYLAWEKNEKKNCIGSFCGIRTRDTSHGGQTLYQLRYENRLLKVGSAFMLFIFNRWILG